MSLKILLLILGILSLLMGFGSYRLYRSSERIIADAVQTHAQLGKSADLPTCLNASLDWLPTCDAIQMLCDASLPRVMTMCLMQQDRRSDCAANTKLFDTNQDRYRTCRQKNLPKRLDKACANALSAAKDYCSRLSSGSVLEN